MEYVEHIKGLGFRMQKPRNSKVIVIFNWDNLISDMVYKERLTIWRKQSHRDFPKSGCLYTHSTPKLRRLMAGKLVPFLK